MKNLLLVVLTLATLTCSYAQKQEKPNIVVMMVDNLGWGELACYGGGILRGTETPQLDNLASEGMRFLNFNAETQCTPSRSAFLTGRHPIRSGTTKVVWGILYGLTQWEVTMAELMADQGYTTGMFGKWHLGDVEGRFPTDQGFDEWYGIANTTDESQYSNHYWFDPSVAETPAIQQSTKGKKPTVVKNYDIPARQVIDEEITMKTIDFMERSVKSNKPFFAFVPFTQPHQPVIPHPDFKGKTGNGNYADVIAEIDHRAGQILESIDDLKIRDNTVVVWLSDNGPEEVTGHHGTAGFWRGFYFTALEGSLRVPAMVRWPGKIKAGQVTNEIVHMTDMLPTLAAVAGAEVPTDRMVDGVNQMDFLLGKQEKSNREGFPVYNGDDLFAYKWRNWKIHFKWLEEGIYGPTQTLNVPKLFNLIEDPKELYSIEIGDLSGAWVAPVVMKKVVAFQKTLMEEPPIQTGTPDPYVPK